MVSQTVKIVGLVILILLFLVLAIVIAGGIIGEDIANKTCKQFAGHFDPIILTPIGIRPSQWLCDIILPEI